MGVSCEKTSKAFCVPIFIEDTFAHSKISEQALYFARLFVPLQSIATIYCACSELLLKIGTCSSMDRMEDSGSSD